MASDLYRPAARLRSRSDTVAVETTSPVPSDRTQPTPLELASSLFSAVARWNSAYEAVGGLQSTGRDLNKMITGISDRFIRSASTAQVDLPEFPSMRFEFPATGPNAPTTRVIIVDTSGGNLPVERLDEYHPLTFTTPLGPDDEAILARATSAQVRSDISVPFIDDDLS